MSESSSRSSWRPDQVCGTFVLPGAIGLLDRFSGTTERLAQALHFFSLNEGQPSGWPSRASRTVGRGSRQLLWLLVLPHLRMLPAILRMIVPAVSDESRAGGTHGREPAARRFTLDRKHATARGVLRSRVRQSAASRESSWTARTPPSKPGRKAHNCYRSRRAGGVSPVDAALPPVGHLHDAPPTAPVHPTATCRVVARADRCSRCSPVRYVTV